MLIIYKPHLKKTGYMDKIKGRTAFTIRSPGLNFFHAQQLIMKFQLLITGKMVKKWAGNPLKSKNDKSILIVSICVG